LEIEGAFFWAFVFPVWAVALFCYLVAHLLGKE
jgi:hypothetical protein